MIIDLLHSFLNFVRRFRPVQLHWAHIDLAASAMFIQLAFNRLPIGKTETTLPQTFVLGLSIFIVASIDRLLDNRKASKNDMKRFLPNQQHRVTFLEVIAGGLMLAIFLSFYIVGKPWKFELIVSGTAIVCLWIASRFPERSPVHALRVLISTVLLLTAILGPQFVFQRGAEKEIRYCASLLGVVLFQNLLLSAYYQAVAYPQISNLAGILKAVPAKRILHSITVIVITAGVSICMHTEFRYTQRFAVILALMSVIHTVILQNVGALKGNKYRDMLITMVLALPGLIL